MEAQTIDLKTSHVPQLIAACVGALALVSDKKAEDISVEVGELRVNTALSPEPDDTGFIITKGQRALRLKTTEDLSLLVCLLEALDEILEDNGGPMYCYAGNLITCKFSAKWDSEYNMTLAALGEKE